MNAWISQLRGIKEQRALETQDGMGTWELVQPGGQNWSGSISLLTLIILPDQPETPACRLQVMLKLPGESPVMPVRHVQKQSQNDSDLDF